MKKIISILGLWVCMTGCAHQPETIPENSTITQQERAGLCQVARQDKELFCDETGVSRTFRDAKCWEAKRKILKYCD